MLALVVLLIRSLYYFCMTTILVYTTGQLYLLYTYLRNYRPRVENGKPEGLPVVEENQLPNVTVQLPLFNERYVARRIIDAVAALDYPRDRLYIQVLDDSTDDTTEIVREHVFQLQQNGLQIELFHRINRKGYKAGALAEALPKTQSEFIAIFDADFVPAPDFLRLTVPFFLQDEKIGVVQTRWGHLNPNDNWLTAGQALAIDTHFAVEQQARSRGHLMFSFNGTGGLWRRQCINDAGGWQSDTLTEDFDLSYRAQIKGWRFVFLRDVVVPGELPPQMFAYRQQQARWAKGSTQVFMKMVLPLLFSNLSLRKRFMGVIQLFQYTIQPVMLLAFILTPLMILTHSLANFSLAPALIMSLGGPLLCVAGQQGVYHDWPRRSLKFPLMLMFSTGMVINNSRAAVAALLGKAGEFKRTPKYNIQSGAEGKTNYWQRSQYTMLIGNDMMWEFAFAAYAFIASIIAQVDGVPSFIPFFVLYGIGFLTVALWDFNDKRTMHGRIARPSVTGVATSEGEAIRQVGR